MALSSQLEYIYPPVTDDLLAEMVRCIRAVSDPIKIVLFGSRARGDARPDSDIDILIVEESDLPCYKRAPRYLRALVGLFPSKDIVVWTPTEIEEWVGVPNAFITTALREGKVLYQQPRAKTPGLVLAPPPEGGAAP